MSEQVARPQDEELGKQAFLQYVVVREGVELRPLAYEDSAVMINMLEADPSIRQRVSTASRMHTEEDVRTEVDAAEADKDLIRYAVVENDVTVGLVSLWRDDGYMTGQPNPRVFGFGFFLHPNARGRSLVTDSVRKLMDTVQANLEVDSFIAFCEDDNPESIAALQKVGLEPTDVVHSEPENGWAERMYKKEVSHE